MFRFQHPDHLYLLILIPMIIFLFIGFVAWRKKKLKKIGEPSLIKQQLLGVIPGRPTLKFILLLIALTTCIFGWANLQKGAGTEEVERKGVDVLVALDVSKSMLATDIQPSRLVWAKQLVMSLLDKMKQDRVGLIVFAGHAYQQVPLTVDYSAVKMNLAQITPGMIPAQGTVLSEAIDLAKEAFPGKNKKYKTLILISDGEDHDDRALEVTRKAADAGIIVHTIGIGSPQGTTLIDPETQRIKTNNEGEPVISRLNEAELKRIASAGGGTYHLLKNIETTSSRLAAEINGMEKKSLGAVVFNSYDNYFYYFLGLGFLILVVEWFIPSGRLFTKSKPT